MWCALVQASTALPTLEEVRSLALSTARAIETAQYSYQVAYSMGLKMEVSAYRSQEKYLIERRDVRPANIQTPDASRIPLLSYSVAFNGQQGQRLNRSTGVLKVNGNPPRQSVPDILVKPYSWLLTGQEVPKSLESLRRNDIWEEAFRTASVKEVRRYQNDDCVVIMRPTPHTMTPSYYLVYLSPRLGLYPIKYERFDEDTDKLCTKMEVTELLEESGDGGKYIFPLRVLCHESGADGVSYATSLEAVANRDSVIVNLPIDNQIFTISPDRVRTVVDVDAAAKELAGLSRDAASLANVVDDREDRFWESWMLLLNFAIVAILAIAILFRLRNKRSESQY